MGDWSMSIILSSCSHALDALVPGMVLALFQLPPQGFTSDFVPENFFRNRIHRSHVMIPRECHVDVLRGVLCSAALP